MNKVLSDLLNVLNGVLAVALLFVGFVVVETFKFAYFNLIPKGGDPKTWLMAYGLITGIILAGSFCGVIAVMLDTRNVLRRILIEMENSNRLSQERRKEMDRKEPSFEKAEEG